MNDGDDDDDNNNNNGDDNNNIYLCVIIFYLNSLVRSLNINKLLRYFSLHDDLKLSLFLSAYRCN